jgi:phosphoserine phosphatase RsbU/P
MEAAVMHESHPAPQVERGRVLIADDEPHILVALQMLLRASGFSTETVTHPTRLLGAVETEQFDAVLMDLNYTRGTMEGSEGLELVSKIRAIDNLLPLVVMTAWSSVDLAVEAMRRGASDFIQKPWDNRELLRKLDHQLSLARAQRREKKLHEEELQEARDIQHSLLPKHLPEIPGFDVAAMTQPLRFVGGDYYTVVPVSQRHTVFCIADVSGKGLPAALLMSSLQAALKPLMGKLQPHELSSRLNRILCDLTPVGKFISFFYAVLDNVEGRLTYCNAGHNPPLVIRADGTFCELECSGAVLGQFPHWPYEQCELQMHPGDELLVFTDGLVEAGDADDKPFGENNLVRIARENLSATAADLMRSLLREASAHCHDRFQDDASLIVLKARAPRAAQCS